MVRLLFKNTDCVLLGGYTGVEPPNKRHLETSHFVLYREVRGLKCTKNIGQ